MIVTEPRVFNIPAGVPFAKTLALHLIEQAASGPEALADIKVLLPNRRACRALREAFLEISAGKPLILPRMQAIGDVDEEELSLSIAGGAGMDALLDLPPAITPMKRQLLLARLISSIPDFQQGFDHALVLAAALGRFMDQIYTENLQLSDLHTLVPDEFATHWQITLKFLEILSHEWPNILAENNVIDIADRRNRLILALQQYWAQNPPRYPVIAAGTTGSIPAVAKLLSTIARLPEGCVVLPGLDQEMDEESWQALDETHPQYGLKHLLEQIGQPRDTVKRWPNAAPSEHCTARAYLAREIMRPAATSHHWTALATQSQPRQAFERAFTDLHILESAHEGEEAQSLALLLREVLEEPEKTAALITPDRALARRVRAACARWGIALDDSAGAPLDHTSIGAFALLVLEALCNQFSPVSLLSVLKHPLCNALPVSAIQQLERALLRGPKPRPGFAGLYERLARESHEDSIQSSLEMLEAMFAPLTALADDRHDLKTLIKAHVQIMESLYQKGSDLWSGEESEALSKFLSEILDNAQNAPKAGLNLYRDILAHMMHGVTVRPSYGTHPRLAILGQLEARLIDADLVILAGLNEGTWPPEPGHDPWMSRPMRKEFGLPVYERSVGLAAHDFVQGLCAPRVVLSRAKRKDGAPTIPARWLQRLDTVLSAANLSTAPLKTLPHQGWAAQLDHSEELEPAPRPAPTPPLEARPQGLSATRIETWLKDPYSIYARYVLKLEPLKPLEEPLGPALRGEILHDVLENFMKTHPRDIPANAAEILHSYAHEALENHAQDEENWHFWWPRFDRICDWLIAHEQEWRHTARPLISERTGETTLEGFTLRARADRIDQTPDGLAIIDYKSGGSYSLSAMKSGATPQLPIEALIAAEGGFEGVSNTKIASLEYWILSGSASQPGSITALSDSLDEVIATTKDGLSGLIEAFKDPQTPYYSLPRADFLPRFNDYEHLARVKEWSALGESEGEDAA